MHVVGSGKLTDYAGNLGAFINQIPDYALFMLDPAGCIASWNVGAERLKGYTAQEIIGRNFSVFYATEDVAMGQPVVLSTSPPKRERIKRKVCGYARTVLLSGQR